jgi:glycosyltransferase involved in cell wall biosynthesis
VTTDLRWFSPNKYGTLVVPGLRRAGLTVATEGAGPAGLAVAIDGQVAEAAYRYSVRNNCPLVLYLWDLPPWRLGEGRADWVGEVFGRLVRVPRLTGGYPERAGFYSRLQFIGRQARAVWVPSEATAGDVRARFGLEPEVVPYCFDSTRFVPGPWRPASPLRLFTVSRLVPHKNQGAVIRAAARLDPSTTVHLIGQGPDAGHLQALAARLYVDLVLESHGVSDDVVVAGYRRSTVVVAPSRFEGFGLTPIEGLASGIPVVASDIGPHREFLDPRTTFVPLDDDEALANGIRAAIARGPIADPALAAITIEAAVDRFVARCRALLAG